LIEERHPMTTRLAFPFVAVAALAGCASTSGPPTGPLAISGSLVQLNRTPMPANGEVVLVLQQGDDKARVVEERRFALESTASTVPFALSVERAQLDGSAPFRLRSSIVADGKTVWVGDPVDIDTRGTRANAGPVPLTQASR
jgi:hypothetical protein